MAVSRALPPRGPVGAAADGRRGDAEHAAVDDHHRQALHLLAAGARRTSQRLVFRCAVRNGLRRVQIADPSNDPADLARMAAIARAEGVEEVVIGLTYSVSPVHTDAYYGERAARDARVPRRRPAVPEGPGRARDRRPPARARAAVRGAARVPQPPDDRARRPGLRRGARGSGSRALHTAVAPLANGTSQPGGRDHAAQPRGDRLRRTTLDVEALAVMSAHFRALALEKGLPLGAPAEYDAAYYHHQMPGGMVTTMRRQLEELRRPELFDAALEETGRVREEFGWPIMVTPFSQFVGTQAVMNVMGERALRDDPRRRHRLLPRRLRHAARAARPGGRRTACCRSRAPRSCARSSRSTRRPRAASRADLRRGAAPAPDDARRAGRRDARRALPPRRTDPSPVVRLLREVARRPSIAYLRLRRATTLVEYRRAWSSCD